MTREQGAFIAWWERHFAEWQSIRDELLDAGKSPSAADVTLEQYRRMNARGESVFEARRRIAEFCGGRPAGATGGTPA